MEKISKEELLVKDVVNMMFDINNLVQLIYLQLPIEELTKVYTTKSNIPYTIGGCIKKIENDTQITSKIVKDYIKENK